MSETKVFSLVDVKKHTSSKDCWTVVHNKVNHNLFELKMFDFLAKKIVIN
jgi:hypothetical protein